jgi:hypothetical protein
MQTKRQWMEATKALDLLSQPTVVTHTPHIKTTQVSPIKTPAILANDIYWRAASNTRY